jgi:hypothetical protein
MGWLSVIVVQSEAGLCDLTNKKRNKVRKKSISVANEHPVSLSNINHRLVTVF